MVLIYRVQFLGDLADTFHQSVLDLIDVVARDAERLGNGLRRFPAGRAPEYFPISDANRIAGENLMLRDFGDLHKLLVVVGELARVQNHVEFVLVVIAFLGLAPVFAQKLKGLVSGDHQEIIVEQAFGFRIVFVVLDPAHEGDHGVLYHLIDVERLAAVLELARPKERFEKWLVDVVEFVPSRAVGTRRNRIQKCDRCFWNGSHSIENYSTYFTG